MYTDSGILVRRFVFNDLADKVGKPIFVSRDGQTLLFKMNSSSLEISIVKMSILGLELKKTLNIKTEIDNYLTRIANTPALNFYKDFLAECDQY